MRIPILIIQLQRTYSMEIKAIASGGYIIKFCKRDMMNYESYVANLSRIDYTCNPPDLLTEAVETPFIEPQSIQE